MPPNGPTLSEMTVTCHQCGSASMERLDRKEYRCTHCGAITIISDDDADRVERLVKDALNRPGVATTATVAIASSRKTTLLAAAFVGTLFAGCLVLPILFGSGGSRTSPAAYSSSDSDSTVPVNDVTISELHWRPGSKTYEGTIYNHSGFAIDVPSYEMTLFVNGLKGGSTSSETMLRRLLPGEYEPISFRFFSDEANTRYEIEKPGRIDRNTDAIAPMQLIDQQLVVQQGDKSAHKLIGIVQNTLTRPVDATSIVATLYGADHQVLGSGSAYVPPLRPGEKAAADVNIYTYGNEGPVTAYEYLVDASFSDRTP